ncbi:hypothetical protein J7I92_12155 [Arthrobacter sp. ISL-72]|nr:hypothetical protein [Arthrobacter sp. ISL-72]
MQLDWQHDSIGGYASRLGRTPALYGRYVGFPLTPESRQSIKQAAATLSASGAGLLLTLEPRDGLDSVTPEVLASFTKDLTTWTRMGIPIMVRFGHEMNGSWYPWGQQPTLFIEKFRQVAAAVHPVPGTTMLWAPNEGGGYPFSGGQHAATAGTENFRDLDTNHDGVLSMDDDPYAPYWPGDDAVDWVGLTVYHFGDVYPWGKNKIPEAGKLEAKITGTYKSALLDETALPDFYQFYAVNHAKPFAISETGAFYNSTRNDGATPLEIKRSWWNQVFDPGLPTRFPQLKLILWFEYSKDEREPAKQTIDWRVTSDPTILAAFQSAFPPWLVTAPLGP